MVHYRERAESGLSVKAFCGKAGFHENIYYYWQRKLREAARGQLAEANAMGASTGLMTRSFSEVTLSETSSQPLTECSIRGEIRIEAAGARITADSGYPPANLAELIKGLSQC